MTDTAAGLLFSVPANDAVDMVKWDGKLHRPVKFGEGLQPGTVEWAQRRRQARAHAAAMRRATEQSKAQQKGPVRWYLVGAPYAFFRMIARLVERR